jgi:hypothetical protein
MAAIEFSERERQNALVLIIHNEHPLDAAEVSSLLRDLNADYKRVTSSRLVLARFETGSSGFLLYDFLILAGAGASAFSDIVVATGHMTGFVELLKGFFKGTQTSPQNPVVEPSDMSMVAKIGGRLADMAIKNGVEFDFSYEADAKVGTQRVAFRVTPPEAREAKSREKARQQLLTDAVAVRRSIVAVPNEQIEDFTRKVIAHVPSSNSFDQIENLVEAFVQFMKDNGNSHLLSQLALSFEMQGRSDIATVVRRHIKEGPGTVSVSVEE